jgi:hypothetical protein
MECKMKCTDLCYMDESGKLVKGKTFVTKVHLLYSSTYMNT